MLPVSELQTAPPWLTSGAGPAPIVVSTRVRLARNISGVKFLSMSSPDERKTIVSRIENAAAGSAATQYLKPMKIEALKSHERMALYERYLIPKFLVTDEGPSALLISQDEGDSVVVNEEDHVRIQALRPGLEPEQAWDAVDTIDDTLDSEVKFAFDPELGYLTACPTNVGTALRVSVMMHLPALVLTGRLTNVTAAILQGGFTVRGMHGEGSEPAGYFFQLSNQRSLGRSEGQIVSEFRELVKQIEGYEEKSRKKIAAVDRITLEDRIVRAKAVLDVAKVMSSQEAVSLLSMLRLGVAFSILESPSYAAIDHLVMLVQPGHIKTLYGGELSDADRDKRRPELIRKYLST
jgi:protein arginine kinase